MFGAWAKILEGSFGCSIASQTGPPSTRRPILTLMCCGIIILVIYLLVFVVVGKAELLRRAAQARPYATFYIKKDWPEAERKSEGRLILFFGDSTLLKGRSSKGRGAAEMLESKLVNQYPDLGNISVIRKAFGGATLFHFYCLLFQVQEYSPDLIIIPINWVWLGAETDYWRGKEHLNQMASMVPIGEFFSAEKGNPLKYAKISLWDISLYQLDMFSLCATGMKIWIREKLRLPALKTEDIGVQWMPFGSGGSYTVLCPEHPSLDILKYISKTAERRNIRVLFYLAPLPLYKMENSPTFDRDLFQCSVGNVMAACATQETECMDLTGLLGANSFTDGLHYNTRGHAKLAAALAPKIHEILSEHTVAQRVEEP